jgi:hypothetical protein
MNWRPSSSEAALRRGEQLVAPGTDRASEDAASRVPSARQGRAAGVRHRGFRMVSGIRKYRALIASRRPIRRPACKAVVRHQGRPSLTYAAGGNLSAFLSGATEDLGRRFSDAVIALVLEETPRALAPARRERVSPLRENSEGNERQPIENIEGGAGATWWGPARQLNLPGCLAHHRRGGFWLPGAWTDLVGDREVNCAGREAIPSS